MRMKFTKFIVCASLASALAWPLAALAQQDQQPPQGAAPQAQGAQPEAPRERVTPSEAVMQRRWGRHLNTLNLSTQQQQQIQSLISQYAKAHAAGSPLDLEARHTLEQQIYGLLTPDQQNQLRQERQEMRQQRAEQNGSQQGQPQNAPPPNAPPANPPR